MSTPAPESSAPTAPEPVAEAPPDPEPDPEPETPAENPTPSPPGAGGWAVQVASFNDLDHASRLTQRMREKGFDAFTRKARVANRDVFRVYAGPVADKEGAEQLRRDVESAFGERGLIVRNPVS
ncbi:MAG: SPOR domain-containing protein [Gammaproteobacteria bacterium]